jgi:high-affinity Fe2+/Pb2+ permease
MGKNIGSWVKMIVMIIGVIMVGAGIYQVAKNLISHGKGQTNWIVTFALIIIGAVLMLTGGWDFIKAFSKAGGNTLKGSADGTLDDSSHSLSDFNIIFDN